MADTPEAQTPSRSSTPNPRFTSQAPTAEELLKEQTVGLVHLSDFRKRRAEALEQVSRDATPSASGTSTPDGRESATTIAFKKKRKKGVKTGALSFGDDEEEGGEEPKGNIAIAKSGAGIQSTSIEPSQDEEEVANSTTASSLKKRLKPNTSVSFQPKVHTKSALRREAQLKDALRKEYAQMQEAVRQTEFCLPFVFFDGKDAPGGACRMKKGDFVWLFLDKARKVGAERAAAGNADGRERGMMKDWARISVDDLMLVRGELILGHHYDFHHFILNRSTGYNNVQLFPYSSEPTSATPKYLLQPLPSEPTDLAPTDSTTRATSDSAAPYLTTAASRKANAQAAAESRIPDSALEAFSDDPSLTKVVDRRWYERNKHIYPASLWEEYDPEKDYSKGPRKDGEGNSYFFSR